MIDLDRLEALAKAATPGPWKLVGDHDVQAVPAANSIRAETPFVIPAGEYDCDPCVTANDAKFIAAASPDVVLELIAIAHQVRRAAGGVERAYHAECYTCGYVGRSFHVRGLAVDDGDEHEIALGDNAQHHHVRIVESR